ncbi:MAG: S8 family serine peptidase, partial [bacterium]
MQTKNKILAFFLPILLIIPFLLLQTNNTHAAASQQKNELIARAKQQGHVRVIVKLDESTQPKTTAGVESPQQIAVRINKLQDTFLSTLSTTLRQNNKKMAEMPFLVLSADEAGIQELVNNPQVVSLIEDKLRKPTLGTSIPFINADDAWATGFSGAGQTVAIIDTGVDKTHPFLSGKVVSEACYSTNDVTYSATSLCPGGATSSTALGSGVNCNISGCEHGTHVAGIAAGNGTNSGVAKNANIIAIQVFSQFNDDIACGGALFTPCVMSFDSDFAQALNRVYALRSTFSIAAANMSLGGGGFDSIANCEADPATALVKPYIQSLYSANIATIVASGNDGYTSNISFPACLTNAISVGATLNGTNTVTSYSNSASFLSLLAPGDSINSSVPGGGFALMSGTSMAAPHVTGAWAV